MLFMKTSDFTLKIGDYYNSSRCNVIKVIDPRRFILTASLDRIVSYELEKCSLADFVRETREDVTIEFYNNV